MPPPQSQEQLFDIARQIDTNFDGRISKIELFNVYKRFRGWSLSIEINIYLIWTWEIFSINERYILWDFIINLRYLVI